MLHKRMVLLYCIYLPIRIHLPMIISSIEVASMTLTILRQIHCFSSSLFRYPCIFTIRMLIQCGADVNATNFIRNTPLHVFVTNWSSCDESVIDLLCKHGAHLDTVNLLRETAIDLASPVNTVQLLKSKMQLSLKCLCARLIQTNNVSFHKKLSKSLVQFVEHH